MQLTSYSDSAKTTRKPSVEDVIQFIEFEQTPFTSVVRSERGISGPVHTIFAERLRKPRTSGTPEGYAGGTGNNNSKRVSWVAAVQRFFGEAAVTDLQQLVAERGGDWTVRDEIGRARALELRAMKLDIEASALADKDMKLADDADNLEMRGALKWLAASQTPAIPATHQPPAAQRKTGVATITQEILRDLCDAIIAQGAGSHLDMFAGATYRKQIDQLVEFRDPAITNQGTRYSVINGNRAQELTLTVEILRFSGVVLRVHPASRFIAYSETTGAGSDTVALVAYLPSWAMQWLEPIRVVESEMNAGGFIEKYRGYGGLCCYAPRANGYITAA
jgi:hypothetical protein